MSDLSDVFYDGLQGLFNENLEEDLDEIQTIDMSLGARPKILVRVNNVESLESTLPSLALNQELKENLKVCQENVLKVRQNDDQYHGLIESSLKNMAGSLERHLALTDTSPGEYQGILYDFADKLADTAILVSQIKESCNILVNTEQALVSSLRLFENAEVCLQTTDYGQGDSTKNRSECTGNDPVSFEAVENIKKEISKFKAERDNLLATTKVKEVELRNEISSLEEIRQMCRREIDDLKAEKEILRCQNTEEKSYQEKYNELISALQTELSCPVCLELPAKNSSESCPVCRVSTSQQIYSTIAANVVDIIPQSTI